MRDDTLGGTFISGTSLDALMQAARREGYADALVETGPSVGMLTQREGESFEQFALRKGQWVARQRERYDAHAKHRYPILLPDGSTP